MSTYPFDHGTVWPERVDEGAGMPAGARMVRPDIWGESGAPLSAAAIRTAPSTFSSPAPCSKTEKLGSVWAVYMRTPLTSAGVRAGFAWIMSAAVAETTGAAIEV